jgi:hypothetical protein
LALEGLPATQVVATAERVARRRLALHCLVLAAAAAAAARLLSHRQSMAMERVAERRAAQTSSVCQVSRAPFRTFLSQTITSYMVAAETAHTPQAGERSLTTQAPLGLDLEQAAAASSIRV